MKPLLLSFFAAILCYSLFFNKKEVHQHVDEINYTIQTGAYDAFQVLDSVPLYARSLVMAEQGRDTSGYFQLAVSD
jgi:hypothetical protein